MEWFYLNSPIRMLASKKKVRFIPYFSCCIASCTKIFLKNALGIGIYFIETGTILENNIMFFCTSLYFYFSIKSLLDYTMHLNLHQI